MAALWTFIEKGGPVMFPILAVSIVLYERCCYVLLELASASRRVARLELHPAGTLPRVRRFLVKVPERFRQQRILIATLIATGPILGLLGTVGGMITTFDSLANRTDAASMEQLAAGISEALITTEAGLAMAIPALLVLYAAQRQQQRAVRRLVQLEIRLAEAG